MLTENRPRLYNAVFCIVVGLCMAGVTWFLRSGALQLFGVPGGFVVGSLLMGYYLQWYRTRSIKKQEPD